MCRRCECDFNRINHLLKSNTALTFSHWTQSFCVVWLILSQTEAQWTTRGTPHIYNDSDSRSVIFSLFSLSDSSSFIQTPFSPSLSIPILQLAMWTSLLVNPTQSLHKPSTKVTYSPHSAFACWFRCGVTFSTEKRKKIDRIPNVFEARVSKTSICWNLRVSLYIYIYICSVSQSPFSSGGLQHIWSHQSLSRPQSNARMSRPIQITCHTYTQCGGRPRFPDE